ERPPQLGRLARARDGVDPLHVCNSTPNGALLSRPAAKCERNGMKRPLDGIRVLDWTIWQQGPVASMMLADLGADVIKIEERTGGDPGRGVLRASGIDLSALPNFYFEAHNRGKRSLTLDLKRPE